MGLNQRTEGLFLTLYEVRALVAEAYPGEQPTNGWRARAEKLNAWTGAA